MRQKLPHKINEETGVEEKFCPKCDGTDATGVPGAWRPLSEFNKKRASYDGLETKCKNCTKCKSKNYRSENPDYDKEYQEKNKEYLKSYKKEYYMRKKNKKKTEK